MADINTEVQMDAEVLLMHKGDKGDKGDAGERGVDGVAGRTATVKIGAITTTPKSEEVKVTNSGTDSDAILDFVLPADGYTIKGDKGDAGASAYEVAKAAGFTGTAAEWLASLHGKDGLNGKDGINGKDGATGPQGPQGLQGETGAAGADAYSVAKSNGFTGTASEWLQSLHGVDGKAGKDGAAGPQGIQGLQGETGKAAAIKVGKVSSGTLANVVNSGTATDAVLDFTLPTDALLTQSYIADGCRVTGVDNRELTFSNGVAKINGQNTEFAGSKITLDQRATSLVCLKNDATLTKIPAVYPVDKVDNNTVGFWDFNITTAGSNIPNIAVGKSSLAVANDFIQNGGIKAVSGWADYALQLDGTTGYLELRNNTNFPVGLVPVEVNLLITVDKLDGTADYIFNYAGNMFTFYVNTNTILYVNGNATGYSVTAGETFLLTCQSDTRNLYVYVNGRLVYQLAQAITFAVNASQNVRLGCSYNNDAMIPATFHYLEIRNALRTPAQIGEIANRLLMPCYYYKPSSNYPTIKKADSTIYHEWRFDDATVAKLVDTAGSNTGDVAGTTIEASETIGSCQRFKGDLTSTVKIGTLNWTNEITIIAVLNPDVFNSTAYGRFFGSDRGSGKAIICSLHESDGLSFQVLGTWYNSALRATAGIDNFVVIRLHNGSVQFRLNKQVIDKPAVAAFASADVSVASMIGGASDNNYPYKGTISYLSYINRALTNSEIDVIYNNLMGTGRRSLIDDVIPAGAAALAYVRTDGDQVTECNDKDYKYGRRNGAIGGNRRVFLGWQYVNGAQVYEWRNPFGTKKIKVEFHLAQDPNGTNEIPCQQAFVNSSWYGLIQSSNAATGNDGELIGAFNNSGNIAEFNGTWVGTGWYIGCYAEVIEEYEGVNN